MVKGRVRVKAGKSKRWRKGQSGGTNPQIKTHREAAKGRFGNHLSQVKRESSMKLTTDVLASHDENQRSYVEDGEGFPLEEEDTQSGVSVGNSSAYSLIETSHPVFGKVKRLWNSPDESHREICAVLAAVSEIVKAKTGNETETEYFAALLTALESSEDESSTAAIAFLLSLVMEKITPGILQDRFSLISKVLMAQLADNETSNSTALLKSLVCCVTLLLSVQPPIVWKDTAVHRMLQTVINFTIHPKPRLRKSAQKGLVSMLREGGVTGSAQFHPSCPLVSKQCQRMIETETNDTVKLHVLGFLKECIGNFPTKYIKGLCESVLKLLTLGTSITKITGFQCWNGLFTTVAGPQGLTAELNGQTISALYRHQPSLNDSQLLLAWCAVMKSAHVSLFRLDRSLCIAHLPNLFTVLMNCLLAKKRSTVTFISQTSKNIIETCIAPIVSDLLTKEEEEIVKSTEYDCVQKIFSILEAGLKYKYYQVWDLVLELLQAFYSIANSHCSKFLKKSLQSLNELHHTPNFPCVSELETAFGAAVKSLGPRFVLDVVPLKLGENKSSLDFPQSWILPVLKNSVCKAELAFYTIDLLPLAGRMRSSGQEWRTKGRDLEGKLFETLEFQIWSLLPSFCKQCTDIADSFPSIAKLLGTALNERADIRPMICRSLMHLVEEGQNNEMDRSVLAKFSKNFLPILFNLYTTKQSTEAPQDHILLCIKSYLSITEEKLLNSLFSRLVLKLTDQQSSDAQTRSALEDITEAFVPFISRNDLSNLFETISPILDSGNLTDQKKCYKLLNSMLSHQSLEHSAFVEANLTRLQELLLGSLSTAGTGSKKPRLRCLLQIVSKIGPESVDFIAAVVPEVILCTKESNEKCRNIAYQLLKSLGYASQRCYDTTPEESVRKYFSTVLAGLGGSIHMVSATVGAMARLVYEFNDLLGSPLISKLLSSVCIFFSAKSKEVVRSTLIFVKVVIGVLSPSELTPHVEELVTKILKWNENHKSHFRMKSRYILEKLTQKFSYEMIGEYVPQKHKQLMAHIKKMAERKKRQQKDKQPHMPKDDDEDCVRVQRKSAKPSFEQLLRDSDDDESEATPQTNKTSQFKGDGTWLREGEEDEPLDFMDPSVTKRIIGTKPSKNDIKETADSFKIGSDGKMIIVDDDDDLLLEQSTDSEDEEMMAEMERDEDSGKRGRKRTFSRVMKTDQQAADRRSLNLAGGSGIFRKNPRKNGPEDHGSEYRAKKAKGDMKKHGKPDPYAYIQLDRQKLNRRKRAKLSGQFSNILSKAKKGAAKGSKQKRL